MNKKDLTVIVAQQAGISKSSASRALEAVLDTISKALVNDDRVCLVGFGTFKNARTKARAARNPRTGETIQIKAKNRPVFVAGQALKKSVN